MSVYLGQKTRAFSDISLAFEPNGVTGDLTILKNERAINNSLRNLIMIAPKEVPFRHDIGSTVSNYLFELIDEGTAGLIYLEIERTIKYNEPRVELLDLSVEPRLEENGFMVTITYKIVGYENVFKYDQLLTPTR